MTYETFKAAVAELKTEWANSFGEARQVGLWDVFKDVPDQVFKSAVSRLILNGSGYPPRLKEFEEQVELARGRWKERNWDKANGLAGTDPDDTTPTPERLAMVREYVQQISKSIGTHMEGRPDREANKDRLREQLKLISGKDLAAGEKQEE